MKIHPFQWEKIEINCAFVVFFDNLCYSQKLLVFLGDFNARKTRKNLEKCNEINEGNIFPILVNNTS